MKWKLKRERLTPEVLDGQDPLPEGKIGIGSHARAEPGSRLQAVARRG
jgi:hypothetical protein